MNLAIHYHPAGTRKRGQCIATFAVAAIVASFCLPATAQASSICRWVDEKGQAQFSDVVPESYKSTVTCTHSPTTESSNARRDADKESKDLQSKPSRPAAAASNPAPPESAASQPAARQPAERVTESTDCKTWRRLYDESGACFAPFRTARGGIKAEAFAACNEVPNPEAKCGPNTN